MKIKHNKKRNTAFVYEAIVREITVAVIKNDNDTKEKAVAIIKKHFKPNCALKRHLECYRSLYESRNMDAKTSEKIIREAKLASRLLDTQGLFVGHSDLIDDVNKELSPQVFNNFVPNYKTLASIYQIFSSETTPKSVVILENQLIDTMTSDNLIETEMEPIDNLALISFVGKFNKKYGNTLSEEQKNLLNLYISSFADNSLSLKSFLNEEIGRLKDSVNQSLELTEITEDSEMLEKASRVVKMLEGFSTSRVSDELLVTILKTQELVKELSVNVDNN
tara:strand:+ start:260 stop:1093 length:834 start_codon:yes stop_codon:yes gene_type:complete